MVGVSRGANRARGHRIVPRKCPQASRRRLPRASRLSGHVLKRPRASVALRGRYAAPAGAVRPRRPWVRRAGQSPRREGLTPRRPWRDRHPRSVQGGIPWAGSRLPGATGMRGGWAWPSARGSRGRATPSSLLAPLVGWVGATWPRLVGWHRVPARWTAGRRLGRSGSGEGGDPRVGDGVGVPAARAGGPRSDRIFWSFPHRGTTGTPPHIAPRARVS